MRGRLLPVLQIAVPIAVALVLLLRLANVWWARLPYPYDLEWMEGGMLAHAWRLQQGLPLYVEPGPEFVPYVYPPGYASVLAAFGSVLGLSPLLGRAISLFGSLAAAASLGWIVRAWGGSWSIALGAAIVFLGTYPYTGAFLDLVRPDGLFIGLLGASVAFALSDRKGAPVVAGVLLAAAFAMKQNAALFGLPLALGLGLRGVRPMLAFVVASAVPALALVTAFQLRSDGFFLTYLLDVPASHPSVASRVWPQSFQEVGTPLPIAIGFTTVFLLVRALQRSRAPKWATAFVPVAAGMTAGFFGTYVLPPRDSGMFVVPTSTAFFAFGALPIAAVFWGTGAIGRHRLDPRAGMLVGVGLVAVVMSGLMRAHNGGFLNVHIPLFWCISLAFGLVLTRVSAEPGPASRWLVSGALVLQLLWGNAQLDRRKFKPTGRDRAVGDEMVAALAGVEGPVLSPFAAWLPVYAGHPPSLHYMGLWDLEYPGGPLLAETERVRSAVAAKQWTVVLAGNQKFPYDLLEHYEVDRTLVEDKDRAMMPKTGWRARPARLLRPRAD